MTTPTDPKKEEIHEMLEKLSGNLSPEEAEANAAETVEANKELEHPDENESSAERARNRQNAAINKGGTS